jgi:homoserine dehydrogenase
MVAFEAAVAGGIPIIKALREGLTANRIEWIAGIINGTTNFILSEMRDKGLSFAAVLKEAQRLGYAEADPTFDIEGVDAAHKLSIMSAIAFGNSMSFDKAYIEGISQLDAADIRTPNSSATASSCSASPSARPRVSSCASIRR